MAPRISDKILNQISRYQKNEITEHIVYGELAKITKDPHNRKVLERISKEEKEHYEFWKKYTGVEMGPDMINVWKYTLISRIFGITFGIKLMENGEKAAQVNYDEIAKAIPGAKAIEGDEAVHEKLLVASIDEERLRYVSSMVLGLNDALVELSGALAGLTFALQNAPIIAITGLITGIAAALSMASSEYLSTKAGQAGKEKSVTRKGEKIKFEKDPFKAAIYTGLIYLITVLFLIFPYLFLGNLYHSLAIMLGVVFAIIFVFTFYVSVAMDVPFWKRFIETAGISFGIAAISFGIGIVVRTFWGIQI